MPLNEKAGRPSAPPDAGPTTGEASRRFAGRFVLLRTLGRGGMGEVFLAREISTRAECALKRLDAYVAAGISDLAREFEALSRIHHPAVVRVHEFGVAPDGTPYYTMEYVPGESADLAVKRGDWATLAYVAAEVAHALEVLHAAAIAHGDLKPSNVLVRPVAEPGAPPDVKLLDFGLAAVLSGVYVGGRGHAGTPGFAAPERVRGTAPDVASDLYGLGATLYALATGRPTFEGDSVEEILRAQQAGPPSGLTLEGAGTPAGLKSLILRLLASEVTDRPRDAREVRQELEHLFPAVRRSLAARIQNAAFVGREKEFARIERLTAARSGPRLTYVAGDSGLGKSAWLGEVATRAVLAGRPVVRLSCSAFDGPGHLAAAIARRLAGEAGANEEALPEGERLADAAIRWLGTIGRRGHAPLLLLDDAERLDAQSARFIRRLALHPSRERWLIVLAGRAEGAAAVDPGRLLRDGGSMDWIALEPLDEEGAEGLIAARLRAPAPEAIRKALWDQAQGHPGLTVELLLLAAGRGAFREDESGLVVETAALRALGEAGDFLAAVAARLDALPPAARAAGEALAVWGEPAEPTRIAVVEPGVDASAIEALIESRLCVRDDAGRVAWASPSVAEQVVARVDAERRRRLHARFLAEPGLSPTARFRHLLEAGRAVEALTAAEEAFALHGDADVAERAARLAEREGLGAEAAAWWDRTARCRFDDGRYPSAIEAFESALARGLEGERRADSLHLLGRACNRIGRIDDSVARIQEGLALEPPPPLRAKLLALEASAFFLKGDMPRAETLARDALTSAKSANEPESTGWAAHMLALTLHHMGKSSTAEPLFVQAEEAFGAAGHVLGAVRAKIGRALVARNGNRLDEARRLCSVALDEARAAGSRLAETEVLAYLTTLLVPLGAWEDARGTLLDGIRIALEDDRAAAATSGVASLAIVNGLMGRPRAARRGAIQAIRLVARRADRLEPSAWRALAQAERILGHSRQAESAARRALRTSQRTGEALDLSWARIEFGRVLLMKGALEEARSVLGTAADRGPSGDPVGAAIALALAGRGAVQAGDLASAKARLENAASIVGEHSVPFARAHVCALSAAVALAEGRSLSARDEARASLDGFATLPAPADRADAALELAGLALRGANHHDLPVHEWLEQAAASFERLGNRRGRERALALQVQWLKRRGPVKVRPANERDLLQTVRPLLGSILDLRELIHRAMQMAVEQLGAERGVLLLADSDTGRLMPMSAHGDLDSESRRDAVGYSRRVAEQVAASGGSLLIGDAPAEPGTLSQSMVDLRLRSIVCVPMFLGGKVIGAVYLDDSRRSDAFSDSERGLLEGFAHLMALAIDRSRGHDEVRRANVELMGENLSLRQEVAVRYRTDRMIGSSEAMRKVLVTVERAAMTDSGVLITGENGTGKELVAHVLHHASKRRLRPFIIVNCAAIPVNLLEADLFGILPNVATGVHARDGRFKQAEGGTLFLDEIGDMPQSQQVALLSVLSSGWVTPVGGEKPFQSNVRVIAATNRNLRQMIEDGTFREDLWYRLNVIPIEVPPLRERRADIPSLVHHFVAYFAKAQERAIPDLSDDFMKVMMKSDWTGNIRELQNYIERTLAMTPGPVLYAEPPPRDIETQLGTSPIHGGRLTETVNDMERKLVEDALAKAGGNQSLAARELGIREQTIRYRIRKYKIAVTRHNSRTRRKLR